MIIRPTQLVDLEPGDTVLWPTDLDCQSGDVYRVHHKEILSDCVFINTSGGRYIKGPAARTVEVVEMNQ